MKKQILLLLLIGTLCSCSKDDFSVGLNDVIGNWKLVQMTGNIPNSETTGSEMEWQESYLLNSDGTFQKSRDRDGLVIEAFGTYSLIENTEEVFLELNFNNQSEIIGSCSSDIKESMTFQSENIFTSSWNACDGPGLKYEKID